MLKFEIKTRKFYLFFKCKFLIPKFNNLPPTFATFYQLLLLFTSFYTTFATFHQVSRHLTNLNTTFSNIYHFLPRWTNFYSFASTFTNFYTAFTNVLQPFTNVTTLHQLPSNFLLLILLHKIAVDKIYHHLL